MALHMWRCCGPGGPCPCDACPTSASSLLLAVFTQCLTHVSLAGSGKTLIAALLIKDKIKEIKAQGKSVAFLAPTVPLVLQVRHQLQPGCVRHPCSAAALMPCTQGPNHTHGCLRPSWTHVASHAHHTVLRGNTLQQCTQQQDHSPHVHPSQHEPNLGPTSATRLSKAACAASARYTPKFTLRPCPPPTLSAASPLPGLPGPAGAALLRRHVMRHVGQAAVARTAGGVRGDGADA